MILAAGQSYSEFQYCYRCCYGNLHPRRYDAAAALTTGAWRCYFVCEWGALTAAVWHHWRSFPFEIVFDVGWLLSRCCALTAFSLHLCCTRCRRQPTRRLAVGKTSVDTRYWCMCCTSRLFVRSQHVLYFTLVCEIAASTSE